MSAATPDAGASGPRADEEAAARARAAEALRQAFTRLQPQGSHAWNFLAAFTHLGDRYGPDQPGASGTADLIRSAPSAPAPAEGRLGRLPRLRRGERTPPKGERPEKTSPKTELEEAMTQVVEAFRFLAARVSLLEDRLAAEDHPVDGAAWLAPARELGPWIVPVAGHVRSRTPGGDVVHADCGQGVLLRALGDDGVPAHGVEPRGEVALRALERGHAVTICEMHEHLAARPSASLGGVVLSGVVDRQPLPLLLPLLEQCRRSLARGAPLVVVSESGAVTEQWEPAAAELLAGRPLHAATWTTLLERTGFVGVSALPAPGPGDTRLAVAASAPS